MTRRDRDETYDTGRVLPVQAIVLVLLRFAAVEVSNAK